MSPGSPHTAELRGADIIAALKQARIEYVVAVPDITTSDGLLWPISRDPDLRLLRVCKEDEAVSIAAGLSFGDKRALVLIQNTGLLDSINALRAMACEYGLPICSMVGLQGKEPELQPADSAEFGVRIVEPLLDTLGMEHHLLQESADVAVIAPAIDAAYRTPKPVAFLVGRRPVP